jgi:threonine/homoserine/homoserine lactone efflux protein
MFGTQHYLLFLISGILLNLTPGQDTLYIVGRSITQGRKAGLISALGIASGSVIHTLAAAFGLSAILATSAAAFTVVKLTGAAYLVYLGVQMWFARPTNSPDRPAVVPASAWGIYRAGLLTNVLNPKVALFYLAFLPQFVNPAASSKLIAFLFLGATFITTGTTWCIILALAASELAARFPTSGSTAAIVRRLTGALFVGLGARLAVAK